MSHFFGGLVLSCYIPLPIFSSRRLQLVCYFVACLCNFCSNRVEAWTRDVRFVLRQEGRPVAQLVGNTSTVRIMRKDWENTDKATQWIHQRAASSRQPFALYLGLNLPHPYKTESLGPAAGGSTFLTSPYWLKKACCFCSLHHCRITCVCFYVNHYKVLCSYSTHAGVFRAHRCS